MSLFFVDVSCDLDVQQIKKLGVECIPLSYYVEGNENEFIEDFNYDKFYSKVRKGAEINIKPLTEKDYVKIFSPALSADDVIYIYSSSEVYDYSQLFSAKEKLKKKYPDKRFELIDSKNFSAGHGAFCYDLALKYRAGETIDQIIDYSYIFRNEVEFIFVVDSLDPLVDKGLVDKSYIGKTALNINTILALDLDGKLKVIDRVSGRKRALSKLIQIIRQTGQNIADYPLIICDSRADSDVEILLNKLKEYFGADTNIMQQKMSPITAKISGLGVVGVAFHVHRKVL